MQEGTGAAGGEVYMYEIVEVHTSIFHRGRTVHLAEGLGGSFTKICTVAAFTSAKYP